MRSSVRYNGNNFDQLKELVYKHCRSGSTIVYRKGTDAYVDDIFVPVGYCIHIEDINDGQLIYISEDFK
jgi:hypothetical protein